MIRTAVARAPGIAAPGLQAGPGGAASLSGTTPFLQLHDVSFGYPGFAPAVEAVSLQLEPGAFHCLVGRSGCGKTTVLKLAAGLLQPAQGQVLLRGQPPRDPRAIGFVFQSPTLLDWLRVRDNVLLPVSLHRRPAPGDIAAADTLLAQLGLQAHGDRYPRQLSGGQQSRVALARALLTRPPLLLLDEPFAALDAITREELQRDLLRVSRAHGVTVLFVTHDIAEAVVLGDAVSVMADGRIVRTVRLPDGGGARGWGRCANPAYGATAQQGNGRQAGSFAAACAEVRAALGLEEALA